MSPLHLDYRPQTFDEIIGNQATINSLKSILSRQDHPHSYLFQGPSGCGKTTLARLLVKALGCDELEFHELNAANTRGIDTIRETIQGAFYAPITGKIKVYLFDEAHQITGAAAEAMLKFLEDTPPHVYIILCTTLPEKIIKTIKNRCSIYSVVTLNSHEMKKLLDWVIVNEGLEIGEKVKTSLISASEGCPRKLLVMLDQIVDIQKEENQLEAIINTSDSNIMIIDICQKLVYKEGGVKKWSELATMLKTFDLDPENTRRAILGYLSKVLLNCRGEEGRRIALIIAEFINPYFDSGKAGLISSCYMACLRS